MATSSRIAVIIAAAGAGNRLVADLPALTSPKAFLTLHEKPMLLYSVETFRRLPEITDICIVAPAAHVAEANSILAATPSPKQETVVAGGSTRQASVYNALRALPPDTEYVLIHDAARPFLLLEHAQQCLAAVRAHNAAILAIPATDTIKSTDDGDWVARTLDRAKLWLVRTPQAFAYRLILDAHEHAQAHDIQAPDDAALAEAFGHKVRLVPGTPENMKITRKTDAEIAECLLQERKYGKRSHMKIGFGFDSHAFAVERELVLAGVRFPAPGLAGHSDADLICHAVADAVLGAAGLGDIGMQFPDTDPQYAGASSLLLLEQVGEMLRSVGVQILSLDIVLAADAPKISPHLQTMKENLASALHIQPSVIALKGKTTEGTGLGEHGMACWAISMLSV